MLFTFFPSTWLSVGHQRWSQSYLRIAIFFSLTSFAQFASSNFVNSDYQNSVVCNAFNHISVYSVVCWLAEMVTSIMLALQLFLLSFCSSLLTTSWFLLCESPKCVMFFTTFQSTLSVAYQKWSHSLSARLAFFPWHICHSLFLATSRIGVNDVLKPILLVTTFFIYIVLCCSTEMVTTIIFELQLFLS